MAEFIFCIQSVSTDLDQQSVFIECSADIDEDTVNEGNIYLMHNGKDGKKDIAMFDISVDRHIIQLHLRDWAVPNDKYVLVVQKGIMDLMGDYELQSNMLREITFDSDVVSDVTILSPANYTKLSGEVELVWEETGKEGEELVGNFYIEVAHEVAFYNVIYKTFVSGSALTIDDDNHAHVILKDISEPGQYFVRVRPQRIADGAYGQWSNIVTFVIAGGEPNVPIHPEGADPDPKPTSKSDLPIIEDLVSGSISAIPEKLIKYTETYDEDIPENFVVTFPKKIDISEATVTIKRRDF